MAATVSIESVSPAATRDGIARIAVTFRIESHDGHFLMEVVVQDRYDREKSVAEARERLRDVLRSALEALDRPH